MKTYTVVNYIESTDGDVVTRHATKTAAKRQARTTQYATISKGDIEIARIVRGYYYPSHVRLAVRDYDFLAGEYWRDSGTMRAEKYYR